AHRDQGPAEIAKGVVELTLFPVPGAWMLFGRARDARTRALRVDAAHVVSAKLLEPYLAEMAPLIDSAERVRIFPYGAVRNVDFQSIAYRGA
ncbi:hypothetical protein ACSTKP_24195, partial [Vibrio parahaemolyticus]